MTSLVKRVRVALALVLLGLLVQLVTTIAWSPLLFVVFAAFGVTAGLLGALLFLWSVWRPIEEAPDASERS